MSTVVLLSQDGVSIEAPVESINLSTTIKKIIKDVGTDDTIQLPRITGKYLAKVVEYCTRYSENPEFDVATQWELDFCKVEQNELFELILAADYLGVKPMLDLMCREVSNMIKGKFPHEIRDMFGIKNEFTPSEEEEVYRENKWLEDRY